MQKISDIAKKQFDIAKISLKSLLKNKLFYIYLGSFLFVFLSLFFEKAPIYLCAYILFFVCILDKQDAISMLLFFYPFFSIFITKKDVNLYFYLFAISFAVFGLKYLIDVFVKKQKIDWMLVVGVFAYLIYLVLPLHKNEQGSLVRYCNLKYFSSVAVFLFAVYLICMCKNELDGTKIFKVFMAGFLIAGLMGLFVNVSDRLKALIFLDDYQIGITRYNGLFQVPNTLAIIATVSIVITLYLHYEKKIQMKAYLFFAGSFVLGYLTMARSFLYSFVIAFVLFNIFVIIKNKKESWKILLPYWIILISLVLIMFDYTKAQFKRAGASDVFNGYDNSANNDEILNESEDPGRGGLIKKYAKDYLSSTLIILFGRGISYPWLGLSSHNTYLQCLWNTGLVGLVLLVALFILFLKKYCAKKSKDLAKSIFTDPGLYLLMIPILAIAFIENLFMNLQMIIIVLLLIFAMLSEFEKTTETIEIQKNEEDSESTSCDEKPENEIKK